MKTLDVSEAAQFLKMNKAVLMRKAFKGEIPGRKAGRCWVFVEEHLADWISGRYPDHRRELRVIDGGKLLEEKQCQSISEKKRGGFSSPHKMDDEYSKLLGLKTSSKPKSCTTDSRRTHGE